MKRASQDYFHLGATGALLCLIVWCVAWEMLVAPLHPGGSWLALKAVPLLIPLRGVIQRDVYTLQWSSMVILLYFTEGVVRGYSDQAALSSAMAWGEALLVLIYFLCSVLFLRPYKRAAKQAAQALLAKLQRTSHDA